MKDLVLTFSLALALTGCSKEKKDPPKPQQEESAPVAVKDEQPKPQPADAAPATPPPPADPTAGWTEQQGAGFTVLAARAPTAESTTAPTPIGPQPLTMYAGYEPAGFQGTFQAAVSDLSAAIKAGAAMDPKETLDGSVQGLLNNMPEAKVEKDEPIPGDDLGRAITARGNHPVGGPFSVQARIYLHKEKIFMVQALYVDPKDEPLAAAFVASFKFVD